MLQDLGRVLSRIIRHDLFLTQKTPWPQLSDLLMFVLGLDPAVQREISLLPLFDDLFLGQLDLPFFYQENPFWQVAFFVDDVVALEFAVLEVDLKNGAGLFGDSWHKGLEHLPSGLIFLEKLMVDLFEDFFV